MTVDAQEFKDGMRRLVASVTILTVGFPDGRRYGMTATAVCSVSADPPILLCCINRAANTHQYFQTCENFGVNVLTHEDEDLAKRFAVAGHPEERFSHGDWQVTECGVPLLNTAATRFLCQKKESVEMGEHTVFFGEVIKVVRRLEDAKPLLYGHGAFGTFQIGPK